MIKALEGYDLKVSDMEDGVVYYTERYFPQEVALTTILKEGNTFTLRSIEKTAKGLVYIDDSDDSDYRWDIITLSSDYIKDLVGMKKKNEFMEDENRLLIEFAEKNKTFEPTLLIEYVNSLTLTEFGQFVGYMIDDVYAYMDSRKEKKWYKYQG